jgi:hypothetical protein
VVKSAVASLPLSSCIVPVWVMGALVATGVTKEEDQYVHRWEQQSSFFAIPETVNNTCLKFRHLFSSVSGTELYDYATTVLAC